MNKIEFNNKIAKIIYSETPEIQKEYINKLWNEMKTQITNKKRNICQCEKPLFYKNIKGELICITCGKH